MCKEIGIENAKHYNLKAKKWKKNNTDDTRHLWY